MTPLGNRYWSGFQMRGCDPGGDRVARLIGNLKLDRPLSLLLHDDRTGCNMTTLNHIVDDMRSSSLWEQRSERVSHWDTTLIAEPTPNPWGIIHIHTMPMVNGHQQPPARRLPRYVLAGFIHIPCGWRERAVRRVLVSCA